MRIVNKFAAFALCICLGVTPLLAQMWFMKAAPVSQALSADFFSSMETADADTTVIDTTIAEAGTVVAAAIAGSWAQSPTPLVDFTVTTSPCNGVQSPALPVSIVIDAITYTGETNTRAWQRTWTTPTTFQGFHRTVTGSTGGSIAVWAGWLCTNEFTNDGNNFNFDIHGFTGTGGGAGADTCLLQQNDASGTANDGFRAHNATGTVGDTIKPVANNTWYFWSGLVDFDAGECTIQMYTEAGVLTGSPIGSVISTAVLRTGNAFNTGPNWTPENAVRSGTSTWTKNIFGKFNALASDFPYGLP